MIEYTSVSGASVVINPAPFKDATALKKAVEKELSDKGTDIIGLLKKLEMKTLIPIILSLDSSDKVNEEIMKCLVRCTYNGQVIREDIFEENKAREDYAEIVYHCLLENLLPFFKGLLSMLGLQLVTTQGKDQK